MARVSRGIAVCSHFGLSLVPVGHPDDAGRAHLGLARLVSVSVVINVSSKVASPADLKTA